MLKDLPSFYLSDSDLKKLDTGFADFSDVESFFQNNAPDLAEKLNLPGSFWPKIKDNTITNEELKRKLIELQVVRRYDPDVCRAAYLVLAARQDGFLFPAEVIRL